MELTTIQTAVTAQVIKDLTSRWLAELDVSEDTKVTYRVSMGKFAAWLDQEWPREITSAVMRRWRDSLQGKPATINRHLSAVRSFFTWLVELGLLATNPAAGIRGARRRGTSKSHRRDELTRREVQAVLDTCDPDTLTGARDRALLALMAYTGVRAVEIHRADVGDLRTKDDRLVLWVQGKGRQEKDEFVVLPALAEEAVRGWLSLRPGKVMDPLFVSLSNRNRGKRMSRAAIRAMVKSRYTEAGVVGEQKTTHSLRHSAISNAIRHGATPPRVQAMARHSNINTTLIYYHETERTSAPAEDLIDYGGEP